MVNRFGDNEEADMFKISDHEHDEDYDGEFCAADVNGVWQHKYNELYRRNDGQILRSQRKTPNLYFGPTRFLNSDDQF